MTPETTLEDCLPAELRTPTTTITPIAAGLSGAGVYRVEGPGRTFVLKLAGPHEPQQEWQRAVDVLRTAAAAELAPEVVHVDGQRRAVLTAFVADRGFPLIYGDPSRHEAALALLGRTVRRLHGLPLANGLPARAPQEFLAHVWQGLRGGLAVPKFAALAIEAVLAEPPPESGRPRVLGHNDLNPSNLVFDGARILILDWATAAPMDPFYDLATLAVFLRMDETTCLRLLSAYDDRPQPWPELPAGFVATRRLVATLAGTMALSLAQRLQHPGASGAETLDGTLPLAEFYRAMRTGALELGTPEGMWAFGLALLKEAIALAPPAGLRAGRR